MPPHRPVLDRIVENMDITLSGCFEFTGTRNVGYGQLADRGKTVRVHRYIYETMVGPIPEGYELDHLCHNPPCFNPDHLEPVTHAENMRRGWFHTGKDHHLGRRDACHRGHPFDEKNTRWVTKPDGRIRVCRACAALWAQEHRAVAKQVEAS